MTGYRIQSSGTRCTTIEELKRKLAEVSLTLGEFRNGKAPIMDSGLGGVVDYALEDRA
jgi:hypothetical protein